MLIDIKMKKNCKELRHNGCLKIYIDPKKIILTLAFKSISLISPNGYVYLAEILYGV